MSILEGHIHFYREIFKIPGILSEPILTLGHQVISQADRMPDDFMFNDLKQLLTAQGKKDVRTLDFFDAKADLHYDLNLPVPEFEHDTYGLVFDIGALEHVFDTRQCIENCLRMVRAGGYYFLHTVVNGYFKHGLHVFNPDALIQSLQLNKFEVIYIKYSTPGGKPVDDPSRRVNVLMWIVARKTCRIEKFNIPQQSGWLEAYNQSFFLNTPVEQIKTDPISFVKRAVKYMLKPAWGVLLFWKERLSTYFEE